MVKESDKQYLKSLVEKYGTECVTNALLEYSYGGHTFDHRMRSAGQKGEYKGAKGLAVAVPSFLLCSLISPPTALILLMGAVANRVTARWYEQKNTILGALNPLSWAEYIATGNYRNNGNNDDNDFFGKKDDKKTNHRTPDKKDFTDVSTGEVTQDVINQNLSDKDMEEIKKIQFKYWFITFDNNEVLKVMANDKTAAEYFGKSVIMYPLVLKRLGEQISSYEQYKSAMNAEYKVYKAIYSDGQVLYTIGKNEQEATNTAQAMIKGYAQGFDEGYKDVRRIAGSGAEKFKVANVIRLEEQETLEIKFPSKIINISEYANIPTATNTRNRKAGYYWQWGEADEHGNIKSGGLHDVRTALSQGLLVMHTPADNSNNAEKIISEIFRNFKTSSYGKQLLDQSYEDDTWYKVSFLDGDSYVIHDKDKETAVRKVLEFYRLKIKVCKDKYADKGKYINIITKRYEKVVDDFGAKNVKEVKVDDLNPKEININKLKINSVMRDYDVTKDKEVNIQEIKGSQNEMVSLSSFL